MWVGPPAMDSEPELQMNAILAEDFEKFMKGKPETDVKSKLPKEYHDLASAFSKKAATELPPHRPRIYYEINVRDD